MRVSDSTVLLVRLKLSDSQLACLDRFVALLSGTPQKTVAQDPPDLFGFFTEPFRSIKVLHSVPSCSRPKQIYLQIKTIWMAAG